MGEGVAVGEGRDGACMGMREGEWTQNRGERTPNRWEMS